MNAENKLNEKLAKIAKLSPLAGSRRAALIQYLEFREIMSQKMRQDMERPICDTEAAYTDEQWYPLLVSIQEAEGLLFKALVLRLPTDPMDFLEYTEREAKKRGEGE